MTSARVTGFAQGCPFAMPVRMMERNTPCNPRWLAWGYTIRDLRGCGAAEAAPAEPYCLEQIPEELVVYVVVVLHFLGLDEGSEQTRATVGRGLLQVGVASLYVLAE